MPITLILDKSVLQGAPQADWEALCASYTFVMPDVGFFECLKATGIERAACFRRLPPSDNPIPLAHHVGHHLSHEITTGGVLGKPSEHVLKGRYRFNFRLNDPDFGLPEKVLEDIRARLLEHETKVPEYVERIRLNYEIIARHRAEHGLTRPAVVEKLKNWLLDLPAVREFMSGFEDTNGEKTMPDLSALGPDSALIVHFQVHYAMALQRALDHGPDVLADDFQARFQTALAHDQFDADYLVLGVLEGGLATSEKRLRRLFRWLRPNGVLWPPDTPPAA